MANSKRKCGYCGERKLAATMVIKGAQAFCSNEHWIENQVKNKDKLVKKGQKIQRAETRKKKDALKPKSWYVKEAQKWFNKFIRLRDKYETCICCDKPHDSNIQWHAGHFLTTGARPEHRFDEDNCHKQTSRCNNFLSGNVAEYRKRLIDKIGLVRVEQLEQDHKQKNYTIDDLKEIIATYKAKCKELEQCN
ncbi:NinG protein [Vibrio phage 1.275.O._10N.286.54.E11]|nr:NinG protein [Vibrio phage 1.275.O._10N.286.54.E11]